MQIYLYISQNKLSSMIVIVDGGKSYSSHLAVSFIILGFISSDS